MDTPAKSSPAILGRVFELSLLDYATQGGNVCQGVSVETRLRVLVLTAAGTGSGSFI